MLPPNAIPEIKETIRTHVRAMQPVSVASSLNEVRRQCPTWDVLDSLERDAAYNAALAELLREGKITVQVDASTGDVTLDL